MTFDGTSDTGSGVVRQVGATSNTSVVTTGTTEVNLCTITIYPVNGRRYKVDVSGLADNDTAGQFTNFYLRRGINANVGGTQFGRAILDQRMASRTQTVSFWGDFVYSDTTGASPYNVVLVMAANGGNSSSRGDITPMRVTVAEIL